MRTADFRYDLPTEAIAQHAVEPRDRARLLVTSSLEDHRFSDLPRLLDPSDLLVVNRTRVRAARLVGTKEGTGGRIELLLIRRLETDVWECLIRPARRIRVGTRLVFGPVLGEVVTAPDGGRVLVRLAGGTSDVEDLLPSIGEVPLPPYFHGTLEDPERYQTVFAQRVGSAATPTAGLHFTQEPLERLADRGVAITEVELEVGLDTFRPIAVETIEDHIMHRERYIVPEQAVAAVAACRLRGGRVVAVGTTVVRTLEAACGDGGLVAGEGTTDLFVMPGFRPSVVDAVITKLHAPATTLTVMISALLGPDWRTVYETALVRGYRFLSFGDSMFIDDLEGDE